MPAPMLVNGTPLMCSGGLSPSTLTVLPTNKVMAGNQPAANIMDQKPMVNIPPFGMCKMPSNPVVASATAAASGVLTPMPCIPVIAAPWAPPIAKVMIGKMPAANIQAKCTCNWGGMISVTGPGAPKVMG